MQRIIWRAAPIVLLTLSAGCSQEVTAPAGEVMLSSLRFTRAEVPMGDPLVLFAQPTAGESLTRQPFLVRASSGAYQQSYFTPLPTRRPWDALSDAELAAVIADWRNVVSIRFKEAGAQSGVDEEGRSITSQETVARMKDWVREQGVTITREWITQPGVDGTMPGDAALVSRLRAHENVDLVEPSGPGEPETGAGPLGAGDLVAVIQTSSVTTSGLRVKAGDVVTAEYRQPNGSMVTATVVIRE